MKKIFVLVSLLLALTVAKGTGFTLVIATTDTAFAHYSNYVTIVDTDIAHVAQLVAPTQPSIVTASGPWTTYYTALNVYDSSLVALTDTVSVHRAHLRTLELAVLATIGYSTTAASTTLNSVCDQWIEVQGTFDPQPAWIGFRSFSTYLTVVYTVPSTSFITYYDNKH